MRLATQILGAVAIVASALGANAEWINKSGERLPDAEHRKAIGNFGAQLILVPDDEQMFRIWRTPAETVNISTVESVSVGGQANAFVVFSGCMPDKAGHCNVTVQFRVYQPNGRPYGGTPPPMEVWQHKPAPAVRMLELSVQYLKIVIEPQDLLGKYVVVAYVKDHVSNASLQLSSAFTATK